MALSPASTSSPTSAPNKKKYAGVSEVLSAETEETLHEHREHMKKEMAKSRNKNMTLIKELMDATYKSRRQTVLESPTTLAVLLAQYPALRMVSEVCIALRLPCIDTPILLYSPKYVEKFSCPDIYSRVCHFKVKKIDCITVSVSLTLTKAV